VACARAGFARQAGVQFQGAVVGRVRAADWAGLGELLAAIPAPRGEVERALASIAWAWCAPHAARLGAQWTAFDGRYAGPRGPAGGGVSSG
jgi:hypothetical protein